MITIMFVVIKPLSDLSALWSTESHKKVDREIDSLELGLYGALESVELKQR